MFLFNVLYNIVSNLFFEMVFGKITLYDVDEFKIANYIRTIHTFL